MKKMIMLSVISGLTISNALAFSIGGFVGNTLNQGVNIVTAPAKITIDVGKDLSKGKLPDGDQMVQATVPAYAQLVAADKQTDVTKTLRTIGQLPQKANETLDSGKKAADNANQGIIEARQLFPGFKAAVDSLQNNANETSRNIALFLENIAFPAQVLLWVITLFVAAKLYRFLFPKHAV